MVIPRKSRLLEKMRSGEKVITYKLNLSCPRAAEIAAMSGFDGIWICQEHVPTDQNTMCSQILAAKAYDCDCIVRVAKGCYSDYIRPLEADATGIMIPHLMSYEEAEEIVHTVRFHPTGLRPVDGGNADGMYCMLGFKDYIKFMNENRLVIVQIEDPEPLKDLDKICQLDSGIETESVCVQVKIFHPDIHLSFIVRLCSGFQCDAYAVLYVLVAYF